MSTSIFSFLICIKDFTGCIGKLELNEGCAHFGMCISHPQLIDLNSETQEELNRFPQITKWHISQSAVQRP